MLKKGCVLSTTFAEYIVEKQINQGGNGTVFRVHNTDGETYAIKAIDRNKTSTDKLKRFKNELNFCLNCDHPNIIHILDHGTYKDENANIIFYVMPIYNKTLRTLMNEHMAPPDILTYFSYLLQALAFAHNRHIWHRDVKPENILVDDAGGLVLADFGIAHFDKEDLITTIETKKSDRMANFQYAAPEQRVRGGMVDGRADIFAAGLILNEMFTGHIVAGANYVKISDVCSEYGYLDDLVDSLICQRSEDRLYPVEKIVFQLEVLAKSNADRQLLSNLSAASLHADEPYSPMLPPEIIDLDYENNRLIMKLSHSVPSRWVNILKNGNYSHSAVLGYDPNRFHCINGDELVVNVTGDKQLIQRLVNYCRQWISSATDMYNAEIQQERRNQELQAERERQAEIDRLRQELEIKSSLKSLL